MCLILMTPVRRAASELRLVLRETRTMLSPPAFYTEQRRLYFCRSYVRYKTPTILRPYFGLPRISDCFSNDRFYFRICCLSLVIWERWKSYIRSRGSSSMPGGSFSNKLPLNDIFLVHGFCTLRFKAIKITFSLVNMFCKMNYSNRKCFFRITLQQKETFSIFYAKLYILLSVHDSTDRRNEIIFWETL